MYTTDIRVLHPSEEKKVRDLSLSYYHSLNHTDFKNTKRYCGVEIEFSIINSENILQPNNAELMSTLAAQYPIVPELGSYQIEINPAPFEINTETFHSLYATVMAARKKLDEIANNLHVEILPIGLPFYLETDFFKRSDIFTDKKRYRVSAEYFGGKNPLGTKVMYQDGGSFVLPGDSGVTVINELHVQVQAVDVSDVIQLFNYSQMISAPFVALGANSGITNGKPLQYIEQQIDIFEKSEGVFDGVSGVSRVGFFPGYIKCLDDFIDVALSFKPLYFPEDESGYTALDLMLGTYYSWTRIRHGLTPTPHMRIEFRPLSSQPTMIENIAISEFYVKSLLYLIQNTVSLLPDTVLLKNFRRAVSQGMDADLFWDMGKGVRQYPVTEILQFMLGKLDSGEFLSIIAQRIRKKMSPAHRLIRDTKNLGYKTAIDQYKESFVSETPYIS